MSCCKFVSPKFLYQIRILVLKIGFLCCCFFFLYWHCFSIMVLSSPSVTDVTFEVAPASSVTVSSPSWTSNTRVLELVTLWLNSLSKSGSNFPTWPCSFHPPPLAHTLPTFLTLAPIFPPAVTEVLEIPSIILWCLILSLCAQTLPSSVAPFLRTFLRVTSRREFVDCHWALPLFSQRTLHGPNRGFITLVACPSPHEITWG